MTIDIPPAMKQKFGPRARSAYVSFLRGNDVVVKGSAVLMDNSILNLVGATVGPVVGKYARVELPASLLKDLAELHELAYFDIEEILLENSTADSK